MMFDPTEDNKMEPMTKTASPIDLRSYLTDLYNKKNLGDEQRSKLESSIAESKPGAGLTFLASLGAGLAGQNQAQAVDMLNQKSRDKQKELEAFDMKRAGVFDELKKDREIGKFERENKDDVQMDDVESQQSKAMQTLAAKMMPQGDWSKYTARQLDKSMPYLKAAYEQELKATERKEDLAFKDRELGVKQVEAQANRDAKAAAAAEKKMAAEEKAQIAKAPQSLAAGFGKRLEQAENDFGRLQSEGFDRTSMLEGIKSTLAPNMVKGKGLQQQEQAERNFLTALLRRESGAVISDDEFASGATQYFPRVGDSPEVLEQKKRNRDQVRTSLKAEAGPAWDQVDLVSKQNAPSAKAVKTKFYSPKTNKTKVVYEDGTEEIIDGKQ